MITLKDKFLGCIYGLAIGDALGFPVEFLPRQEILRAISPQGVTGFDSLERAVNERKINPSHPIGSYSDDTQMSLATAQAVLESKTEDIEEVMSNIVKRYIQWARSPENDRAPGMTCMTGIRNLERGVHWSQSGVKNGFGCGAAMRTAPIGLAYFKDLHKVIDLSYHASRCTHNETGASAGKATARLVQLALEETQPWKIFNEFTESSNFFNQDFNLKIKELQELMRTKGTYASVERLGQGWRGDEAVVMALYCFLKNPFDYRKAVLDATNISGDSDSIASITGAISGAFNGVQAIPNEWITKIENQDLLKQTTEQLYKKAKERYRILED